jgi:hypothetical protein
MPRTDLLSLTGDDLARISTRGHVTAARKELEGRVTGQLTETPDGAVRVRWSDGRLSEVPAGAALDAGRCSCNEGRVCKHLVRLVLLYQQQTPRNHLPAATEPWDPGGISDDELARCCKPQTLARARQLFDAGVLAELVRASQPLARFHLPVCTVRFLLPNQPAYARCNCRGSAPCEHVALAVWAFRRLPAEQRSGIVTAGAPLAAMPPTLLDAIDAALLDFAEQGVSGLGKNALDRLARLARQCEEADLVWPDEVLRDWLTQLDCYIRHDARFDPILMAALVGELAIRTDALRSNTGALPGLLVSGSRSDRPAELEPGEYGGLGCGIRRARGGVELAAYLYDRKAGHVLAITQEVVEPARDQDTSFAHLADRIAVHGLAGATFAAVGAGILRLPGGKRSPRYELLPGRAQKGRPSPVLLAQETLAWEEIDPPVRMDDFADLEAHLALLPPSSLRPRRVAEDFHVVKVASVEDARFDHAAQVVQAVLVDARGNRALLEHPYTSRGRAGVEVLLGRLNRGPGQPCFVAGQVSRSAGALIIRPVSLVCQEDGRRTLLQPWVERGSTSAGEEQTGESPAVPPDSATEYLEQIQAELGEALVLGMNRAGGAAAGDWAELARQGEAAGFARLSARVHALAEHLDHKAHSLHWDARAAAALVLELTALARLARDLGGCWGRL